MVARIVGVVVESLVISVKAIDLLALHHRGCKIGLFGGVGVGKTMLIKGMGCTR